jgi:hypothetical protein
MAFMLLVYLLSYNKLKTSTEKAKGIWLGADHFSAQYRTKSYLASSDLIC